MRSSMVQLVARVADLIGDENFTLHTREDVEAALDGRRIEARYLDLTALPTKTSGGTTTYTTFEASYTHWENDATFTDSNYDALTTDTDDWLNGRWTFATEPTRPVRILGYTYDIYAAAADLLEKQAAGASDRRYFDNSAGDNSQSRSQIVEHWNSLAIMYRRRQRHDLILLDRVDAY